jgi:hypothetical protein
MKEIALPNTVANPHIQLYSNTNHSRFALMSDRPLTQRTLNNLTSYRTSLQAAIGHLQGLEEATATPRASPAPSRLMACA